MVLRTYLSFCIVSAPSSVRLPSDCHGTFHLRHFLVDDHDNLTVLPLEIKSGKDYTDHSALTNFLKTPDYGINHAMVFSNERDIFKKNGVTYLPIYYCMFLYNEHREEPVILPELEVI